MSDLNIIPAESLKSLLGETTQDFIDVLPDPGDELNSDSVIRIMKAANKSGLIAGWVIGKLLIEVENAIASNAEGFNYGSMAQWFDDYEDDLPVKRSAAKVYKTIAQNIELEQFAKLGYRKSKLLAEMKYEDERESLATKAIEENLTSEQIMTEINQIIKDNLPAIQIPTDDDDSHEHEKEAEQRKQNMYQLSVKQWNPFKGCKFDCIYCSESFQKLEKRDTRDCHNCREYTPHEHPEYLLPEYKLPQTPYMQFIFTCASGDISYCSPEYFKRIITRIINEPDKNFLIQSKNPDTFNRAKLPQNVIIGTTIETNRDSFYRKHKISGAPKPSKRYKDLLAINHPHKMLTLEPMLDFDIDIMIEWIEDIKPSFIWIGTVDKRSKIHKENLEPPLEKIMDLYYYLGTRGYVVMLKDKLIRRIQEAERNDA